MYNINKQNKTKKNIGFSLIELMISLITISCIAAAFTPVLTKKLEKTNVSISLNGLTVDCKKYGDDCSLCQSNKCVSCLKYCGSNEYKNIEKCVCEACTDRSLGCLECDADSCRKCKTGYGITADGKCELCQAGHYSSGTANCKPCPIGQYQNESGKDNCILCPIRQYQNSTGQSSCKICGNGKYQDSTGQSSCKTCPEDNYCTSGNKTPCPTGQGANSGSSVCTSCSSKISNCSECSNLTQCSKCRSGYYINSSKTCTKCTAGYYCNGITQTKCSAGQYSSAGASSCTACSSGYYQNLTGQTSCKTCSTLTSNCSNCNSTTGTCTACANKYYINSKTCTLCPAGYKCVNNSKTQCAAGEYSAAGSQSCTKCANGYYSAAGSSSCSKCSSKWANCATCTNSGCSSCKSGYTLNSSKQCVSTFSCTGDFLQIGNICVTKYNMGDRPAFTIPLTVNLHSINAYCNSNSQNCCWFGKTGARCNANNGGYSGCNRTVCNYYAAKEICDKFNYGGKTWRLPTERELAYWDDYNIGRGSNGLMLCSRTVIDSRSTECAMYCVCPGAPDNCCLSNTIWSNKITSATSTYTFHKWGQADWTGPVSNKNNNAFSVRCVTDMN